MPNLSVIIPVFNTDKYLKNCLDSVLNQTYRDFEIICVDNGSTDSSREILEEYSHRHPELLFFHHPIGKQGEARNFGLSKANGSYIGFVDSDDVINPSMFKQLIEEAVKNCSDLAICNIAKFTTDVEMRENMYNNIYITKIQGDIKSIPVVLRNLTICNKIFRTDYLKKLGILFPTNSFHEDAYFVIISLLRAKKFSILPDALYYYRRDHLGAVNSTFTNHTFAIFNVFDSLRVYLKHYKLEVNDELVLELEILKYIQLYNSTGFEYKREYYNRMRIEFRNMQNCPKLLLLSVSERRQFNTIRKLNFELYSLCEILREIYGGFRKLLLK